MVAAPATWAICALTTAAIVVRPKRWPEWIWAVSGAAALAIFGLVSPHDVAVAVGKGTDVYLFLIGMMLLSETAREHRVFDWVAERAVAGARGSGARLFALVYGTGIVVTTFMSNDATAVVLTPAVFVAAKKSKAQALPLLLACALIANAASFVLPISNPANLVLYGGHLPPLGRWLESFALPSLLSIVVTFAVLRVVERRRIVCECVDAAANETLDAGGVAALIGIAATAALLIALSALGWQLGLPTACAGIATALLVSVTGRTSPISLARGVSWGIVPLVAGLFVLVEGLNRTGSIAALGSLLQQFHASGGVAAASGAIVAFVSNVTNNLPAGLIAGSIVTQTHPPRVVTDALLIGVDLGPNLSVTGSLATILWLQAIRREGEDVDFWTFLRVGAVAMPAALAAALGVRVLLP